MKPVIHIDDVPTMDFGHGEVFKARLGRVGAEIGAQKLGCTLTIVEPGKRAFPYHAHHANEEMFVILAGTGEYRFGDQTHPVRAGDVMAAPCGGKECAHQVINTGEATLKYLCLSTKADPEVVEYPDSDKFLVISQMDETGPRNAKFSFIGRTESAVDYWDGEDGGSAAEPDKT